jgi:hypothetical protein
MTPSTLLANLPVIFADRSETLRDLGGGFRGDQAKLHFQDVAIVVLAGAAVVGFFYALSRFTSWREGRSSYHNPKQLFRKLAAAHSLSFRERWLIGQAARYVNIPLPACLFLRPDLFDVASAHPELSPRAVELIALKRKLFDAR